MDIFIVALDGLEVALTASEAAAAEHARRYASEEPPVAVQILRFDDNSMDIIAGFAVAEAATA